MRHVLILLVVTSTMCGRAAWSADAPPSPPPASSYVPADQLVAIIQDYVTKMQETVADEQAFESGKTRLKKEANTLAALALVVGLHDTATPLQKSAPALVAAAQKLAAAETLADAKSAIERAQAAMKGEPTDGPELQWEKIGSLGQLMKQVTFINARLKRGARPGPRFDSQADEASKYAATLAVIAQVAMADTHEVNDPANLHQWYALTAAMRDSAGEAGAALRERNAEGAQAALKKLEQSCNECHKVFRVETVE